MIITVDEASFATMKAVPDGDLCALRRVFKSSVRCDTSGELPTIDMPAVPIVWSISEGASLLAVEAEGDLVEKEQETEEEMFLRRYREQVQKQPKDEDDAD